MINALAFDVYGTLIDTSGVYKTIKSFIQAPEKAEHFMQVWRDKQLEYSFRRGLMNQFEDFSLCTKQALEYSSMALKVNLSNSQKDVLLAEYECLPCFKDVKKGLETLKNEGHKLYAFSNGSKKAVTKVLTKAEIIDFFDGVISVEEVKVFKPSPKVYEHFIKKSNSVKGNSWLVSSNSFDILGASSYGMKTVWVKRSKASILDPWGVEPTRIVNAITEININLEQNA